MLEQIIFFIDSNVSYAPFLIFFLLLLAGFNIPVSEDACLFISAVLAKNNPEFLVSLFVGVYLGAYLSDLICYFLGRKLGPQLWKIQWFSNMVPKSKVAIISGFYARYGVLTLLLGRFIPFGVRNALFLTAGLGKMNFIRFALADLFACTVSCSLFFYLYYSFGNQVIVYVKRGNVVLFSSLIILLIVFVISKRKTKKI